MFLPKIKKNIFIQKIQKTFLCILVFLIIFTPSAISAQGLFPTGSGGNAPTGSGFLNTGGNQSIIGSLRLGRTLGNALSCAGITPQAVLSTVLPSPNDLGSNLAPIFQDGAGSDIIDDAVEDNPVLDFIDSNLLDTSDPSGALADFLIQQQPVPVEDRGVRKEAEKIQEEAQKAEENSRWMVFKENCLDAIVRDLVMQTLNRITLATVDWINSGFDGKPFYVENTGAFFRNIAEDEFRLFEASLTGLNNPGLQPFGQNIVRAFELGLRRRFEQNMQSSLHQVLLNGASRQQWQLDFSVGGWVGYNAFLQPNNNIFGAYIESAQYLPTRLAGGYARAPALDIQREIMQSSGFLSQRECVATQAQNQSFLPSDHPMRMPAGTPVIRTVGDIPTNVFDYITSENGLGIDPEQDAQGQYINAVEIINAAENARRRSICIRWRTVTPGNYIADSLTSALIDTTRDQLISSRELNDNIGLLFDAVILQAFNGISSFITPNPSSDPGSPNYNPAWAAVQNPNFGNEFIANSNPYIESQSNTNIVFQGGSYNINNMVSLQQNYVDSLINLSQSLALVVRNIRELDYCVPGPNPLWFETAQENMNNYFTSLASVTFSTDPAFYAQILFEVTGMVADEDFFNVTSMEVLYDVVGSIFNQYSQLVNTEYTQTNVPAIRNLATAYYNQMLNTHIPNLQTVLTSLGEANQNLQILNNFNSQLQNITNQSDPQIQIIQGSIQNLTGLPTQGVINQTNNLIAEAESLVSQTAESRDACLVEVLGNDYQGLNNRREYPQNLSNVVSSLPVFDSFFSDVTIGFQGDTSLQPSLLSPNMISQDGQLSVFEDFLSSVY